FFHFLCRYFCFFLVLAVFLNLLGFFIVRLFIVFDSFRSLRFLLIVFFNFNFFYRSFFFVGSFFLQLSFLRRWCLLYGFCFALILRSCWFCRCCFRRGCLSP